MKRTAGLIAISLLMMSLTSLASVTHVRYSSLDNDPSKVEPRADGVLVSKESRKVVVGISQREAEAACADHGGLPDIETLLGRFGRSPEIKDKDCKGEISTEIYVRCGSFEESIRIGSNRYLHYLKIPESEGIQGLYGDDFFWSSSRFPDDDDYAFFFLDRFGTIEEEYRGYGYTDAAALCVGDAGVE